MNELANQLNWLDYLLLLILAASFLASLARGFTREIAGFVALILGLLLGLWFHGNVGNVLLPYVSAPQIASALGFCTIFFSAIALGGVVGYLMSKAMKVAGLSLVDRAVGGAFGLAKGALFGAVVLLGMLAFAPDGPPQSVSQSVVAPYVLWTADVLAPLAPKQLKDAVFQNGERLRNLWKQTPLPQLPPSPQATPKEGAPARPNERARPAAFPPATSPHQLEDAAESAEGMA
jgi:membrane protein required for colicin V production